MNKYLWYGIDSLINMLIAATALFGGAFIVVGALKINNNDLLVYSSMLELGVGMFYAKHVLIERHVRKKMKKTEVTNK